MTRIIIYNEANDVAVYDVPLPAELLLDQVISGGWIVPGLSPGSSFCASRSGEAIVVTPIHREKEAQTYEHPRLTPREQAVLQGLVDGRTVKEISRGLGLKQRTVQGHVTRIKAKFAAQTRAQLVGMVVAWGMCAVHEREVEGTNPSREA